MRYTRFSREIYRQILHTNKYNTLNKCRLQHYSSRLKYHTATANYARASLKGQEAGSKESDGLIELKIPQENIHVIGHLLNAQVASVAAKA